MKTIYNFYNLLNLYSRIKSTRIKAFGLITSSILGFRHLSVRLDPALSCNLFCQMCYFSNSDKRKSLKGQLSIDQMNNLARIFFPKAFQLVLGCGAEPTINRDFMHLFRLAKQYKIPNISIVTNGLLLRDQQIKEIIELGINEIILSAHGLEKINYERFMVNGKFPQFVHLLETINKLKLELNSTTPSVRINYTVNEENMIDLHAFDSFANNYKFETFQVRPIMDIGGKYNKLMDENLSQKFTKLIHKIKNTCDDKNITLLANTLDISYKKKNKDAFIIDSVYTYLSPNTEKQLNLDIQNASLRKYKSRVNWYTNLIKGILNKKSTNKDSERFLKYDII